MRRVLLFLLALYAAHMSHTHTHMYIYLESRSFVWHTHQPAVSYYLSFHLLISSRQMPENMNISVNGQSQVPPGFRFHPTEEELLNYYLKKKVTYEKIDLDVIRDVDLNKLEPWDIQGKNKLNFLKA